jgi:hypothetical protein
LPQIVSLRVASRFLKPLGHVAIDPGVPLRGRIGSTKPSIADLGSASEESAGFILQDAPGTTLLSVLADRRRYVGSLKKRF